MDRHRITQSKQKTQFSAVTGRPSRRCVLMHKPKKTSLACSLPLNILSVDCFLLKTTHIYQTVVEKSINNMLENNLVSADNTLYFADQRISKMGFAQKKNIHKR
jgi:hypothetical protein